MQRSFIGVGMFVFENRVALTPFCHRRVESKLALHVCFMRRRGRVQSWRTLCVVCELSCLLRSTCRVECSYAQSLR